MQAATGKSQPTGRRSGRVSVWKTIGFMLLMMVLCVWVAALAYPLAIKAGIPPGTASRLPNYAIFLGLLLGLGIGVSKSMKHVFGLFGAMVAMCFVFWFWGVVLEGFLNAMNVPRRIIVWVSPIAFGIAVLLCLFTVYIVASEKLGAFLSRHGFRRGKSVSGAASHSKG